MCGLLFVLLGFAKVALSLPLELRWDRVTTTVEGGPLQSPVKYRLYRKTSIEDFKPIAETSNISWTWLAPSIGQTSYYVTAFNEQGESGPSNTVHVMVERWPHEDWTKPTPTPMPAPLTQLKVLNQGPVN